MHQTAIQIYSPEFANPTGINNYTQQQDALRSQTALQPTSSTSFAVMPYFAPDDGRPFLTVTGVDEDAVFCCLLLTGF